MERFASCLAALLLVAPVALARPQLSLEEAREVVRIGDVTHYPGAARALRQAEQTDEVRRLLARIESDLQVRLAFLAREAGDLERARALLQAARRPELETAAIDAKLAGLDALRPRAATSTLPAGAPAPAPETVATVCGRTVPRSETRALLDPVYGQPLHVWFRDPAALRRSQLLASDEAPDGPTLLDLLCGGCGPLEAP